MMDLHLLSKLQAVDSVNLILTVKSDSVLNYYLISRSIVYNIVCTGEIAGEISGQMASFELRLSSIAPLIEKGYQFDIRYSGGKLRLVSADERIEIVPSYVESNDANVVAVLEQYVAFSQALEDGNRAAHQIETLQDEIRQLQANHRNISIMQLSGGPPSDPFTPDASLKKIDEKYLPQIEEKQKKLNSLLKASSVVDEVDLSPFLAIANAASKSRSLVDLCGGYAILSLKNSFMLQKGECIVQSIPGLLLYQLLRDGGGKGFYTFNDNLVYMTGGKERTAIFVAKYLPNNVVDNSIVTKGTTEEKYQIQLKGILKLSGIVKNHFPKFELDLGSGQFILSNDLGEVITSKFEIENANTIQLAKLKRGEQVSDITMATIEVPREVQNLLGLFQDRLEIFVKKHKIIFRRDDGLYLVFGR